MRFVVKYDCVFTGYFKIGSKVDYFYQSFNKRPSLAVVRVGGDLEMDRYVYAKKTLAFQLGIQFTEYCFSPSTSFKEVERCIHQLNHNTNVNGIIVQLPLPGRNIDDL